MMQSARPRSWAMSVARAALAVLCVSSFASVPAPAADAIPATATRATAADIDFASLVRAVFDARGEGIADPRVVSTAIHSSRDQGSITPTEPAGWFSESDTGNVLRIDRVDGRSEWVLADMEGGGAITRIVLTSSAAIKDAVLRVRIDGEAVPSIEWPLRDFSGLIAPKLAPFVVWHQQLTPVTVASSEAVVDTAKGTVDCILPIPFARSCTVTLDRRPDLYRIESVAFAPETRVKRFESGSLQANALEPAPTAELAVLMREASARLAPLRAVGLATAPLEPGARVERSLDRAGVVRSMRVRIDPFEAASAVRDLWVECDFDGERAIRMPLGHFIGLGEQTGPVSDAFRSVGRDGTMEFRLPMPFARSARIAVVNRGKAPLACALELAEAEARTSDGPAEVLHGAVRMYRRMAIAKPVEVELARIDGAGVLVGECFTQHAAFNSWWPRGDDRIKIDGRDERAGPSFDLAFGSAPGVPRYARGLLVAIPAREGAADSARWAASRLRTLDAVRFSESLVQTLELLPSASPAAEITLSHSVFWCARVGASTGVGFDDPAAMPPHASPRNIAPLSETFPPGPGEEWFEAEDLPISYWTLGANWGPESLAESYPAFAWGKGTRVGLLAVKAGDSIEFAIPARDDTPRRIVARFIRSNDAARIGVTVNGVQVAGEIAVASLEFSPSDLIDLGVHAPKDGRFLVRLAAAGLGEFARRRLHIAVDGFRTSQP